MLLHMHSTPNDCQCAANWYAQYKIQKRPSCQKTLPKLPNYPSPLCMCVCVCQQVHPPPLGRAWSSVWILVYCRRPYINASLASSISSLCSTNFREIARNTSSTPATKVSESRVCREGTCIVFCADLMT